MADDVALGRPTEVDAFCGAVVRLARQQGLQAPTNEALAALLLNPAPKVLGGRGLRTALGI